MATCTNSCLGCGNDIKDAKGNRLLNTKSSEHVLPVWKRVIEEEINRRGMVAEILKTETLTSTGRMCRQCFSKYERISKLIDGLKSDIVSSVNTLLDCFEPQQPPTPKRPRLASPTRGRFLTTGNSPGVRIQINYVDRVQNHLLTPSRKKLGKALARKSKKAMVAECIRNNAIRKYVIISMSRILKSEIHALCSNKANSVLRTQSAAVLSQFTWDVVIREMQTYAPVLLSLMYACTETKTSRYNREATIGICVSVLLKYRFNKMCLVQKLIALILYAGHSAKSVYQRLQKLNLCVSHQVLSSLVTTLGSDFDSKVVQWKYALISDLKDAHPVQNRVTCLEGSCSETDTSDDECSSLSSDCSVASVIAPPFSPVLSDDDQTYSETTEDDLNDTFDSEQPLNTSLQREELLVKQSQEEETESEQPHLQVYTFKMVGDNIDLTVKARYVRMDSQKDKSLHYFHHICIRDRVNFSHLPIVNRDGCLNSARKMALYLLPSKQSDDVLTDQLAMLISRMIVTNMPFFSFAFSDVVKWHLEHEHYKEMSTKSEVVPLGVLLYNENKGDEMIQIASHVHQYVPIIEHETQTRITTDSTVVDVTEHSSVLHPLLFGGDQLTAARMRGAKEAKCNSITAARRLEGLIPVIEDWHTKVVLLEVIWKYFYTTDSSGEHCTLYQLRNMINCTSVGKRPKHCFNSCDDFIEIITTGHVLCAAMNILGMTNLNDQPAEKVIPSPEVVWTKTNDERKEILIDISKQIVKGFINLSFNTPVSVSDDGIHEYSKNLMSIGCFYLLFKDAIKEGDGRRVLDYYRYLLPIFINSGRRNYSNEALHLLCQYNYDLPPQQAEQLMWSRFINTAGIKGRNIPVDLHQEHLNRVIKTIISGMGANKTKQAIVHCSKALGTIDEVIQQYDKINNIASQSGAHGKPPSKKELGIIIKELQSNQVFETISGRRHPSFKKPVNILQAKPNKNVIAWLTEHLESRY